MPGGLRQATSVCGPTETAVPHPAASLAGGSATTSARLLAARAVQGVGAAIVAPTALALIATTFPEGQQRGRAFGLYAATTPDGVSHWGDAKVVAALAVGTVLLAPSLVIGAGMGLLFVPVQMLAFSRVPESDSGIASSLLNTGRQVGGALGLAVLGTVAWTVTANTARAHTAGLTATAAYSRALAAGLDRAFLVAAGIAVLILVTAVITVRSGASGSHDIEPARMPAANAR